MIKRLSLICAVAVALLWNCTAPVGSDTVADAAEHFDNGNYSQCRAIVDRFVADSAALDTMPVADLCRLAVLCLRLDSVGNDNSGEAMAAQCLVVARRENADSVNSYLRSLPRETAQALSVIDRVASYLVIPRDSLVVEGDTIQ